MRVAQLMQLFPNRRQAALNTQSGAKLLKREALIRPDHGIQTFTLALRKYPLKNCCQNPFMQIHAQRFHPLASLVGMAK